MRYKILSVLAASAALAPFMAQAEDLSYTYVEAGYLTTNFDEFNESLGGFGLRASIEITDKFFAFGTYADQKTDVAGYDIKFQPWELGVGYAYPITDSVDLYGTVGYISVDADAPSFVANTEDDGYQLGVGLRTRFAERFEVEGVAQYQNLSDFGDEIQFDFMGRWYVIEHLALGLGYSVGDETDTFAGSVRWEF
jgi:hypothetical protein